MFAVCSTSETLDTLKRIRSDSLSALRAAIKTAANVDVECRLGHLLLVLPDVRAVASQLVEDVQ